MHNNSGTKQRNHDFKLQLHLLLGLHYHHQNYKKKKANAEEFSQTIITAEDHNSKPRMEHTQFSDYLTVNK